MLAGDTMVLFMTTNSLSGTLGSPAGWTLLQSKDGTATRGRAWTKQATATDANANVTVTGTTMIKDTMSVGVYRSDAGTSTVTASASIAGTTTTTQPRRPVGRRRAEQLLAGQLVEREVLDGHDLDQARDQHHPGNPRRHRRRQGQRPARRLQRRRGHRQRPPAALPPPAVAGGGTQLFSVVVSPGIGTVPANQPPVPSFTVNCNAMTCGFNASATTDPENNPLTYNWAFGDGDNGTGVTTSRTYTTAGNKTVTLTVSDGTNSAQTTRTAAPSSATAATLSFVDAASSSGNRTGHVVRLPANVLAGDRLVLFLTVNSLSGTLGSPAGWTLLQGKDGTATRGRVWTKHGHGRRRERQRHGHLEHAPSRTR